MQLSSNQIDRITKRFIDKDHPQSFLRTPYKSDSHLIATNSHMMLFLSNHAINDYTLPQQAISDTEKASILRLERHLVTESSPSSNQLTLDGELIQSIISSLKQHKKELRTRRSEEHTS